MSDGPVVGVVGPEDAAVESAVRAAGGDPRTGAASAVLGCDYVVAVGEASLLAVARAGPEVPVLPVDAGRGVRSVPGEAVAPAVRDLLGGAYDCEDHPLFEARVEGRSTTRVLQDLTLVSAEPAHISEYTVRAEGERVGRVRADGVVVATPAGSSGYAAAVGGPVAPPETDVLAVVPVAPFSTDAPHWSLPATAVSLTVERDETAVDVVGDDRVVEQVGSGDTVRVSRAASVAVAVVEASQSCFGGA